MLYHLLRICCIFLFLSSSLQSKKNKQYILTSNDSVNQVSQIPLSSNNIDIIQMPSYTIDNDIPTLKREQILQLSDQWTQSSMIGQDVSVTPEGDIYIVGIDGKLYLNNIALDTYTRVIGDPDLDGIIRVSTDDNGTPYIVTSCGATYYLGCNNKWIQLPGCATDIGVGLCGQVWKTGCDPRPDGFGIWKLFCKGKDTQCHRFRPPSSSCDSSEIDMKDCYWYRVSGSGIRLDVFPDGRPGVIQANGNAIKYIGDKWKQITKFKGRDISISNEGLIVMAGADSGLFFIKPKKEETNIDEFYDSRYGFTVYDSENLFVIDEDDDLDERTKFIDVGCTMSVSAGPFGQPVCIPCASQYNPVVIMTQKFNYN